MKFDNHITIDNLNIQIIDGDRGKNYPNKKELTQNGHTLFLNNKNLIGDKLNIKEGEYISKERDELLRKGKLKKNDIVISTRGSIGNVGYYNEKISLKHIRINSGMVIVRNEDERLLTDYLYHLLKSPYCKRQYEMLSSGSVQKQLPIKDLKKLTLKIPPITVQESIIYILNSIENKYDLNTKLVTKLEELAQTLFKHWFVDFEFPNEEGKPYKSSGGKMVESELGMIPEGWSQGVFKDITQNFDRKRVPLSKLEREKRDKIYPYYGAASLMDYVDDYIFDGIYVLVGEDGTVIDDKGYPILQYVWGKLWVNNHAHVLQGKDNFTTEFIYLLLKRTNVRNIVTGAVQPKINQTNLNKIPVIIPNEITLVKFKEIINSVFTKVRNIKSENDSLEELRDTLLPKLLSGEIELPDDMEVTDDVPVS